MSSYLQRSYARDYLNTLISIGEVSVCTSYDGWDSDSRSLLSLLRHPRRCTYSLSPQNMNFMRLSCQQLVVDMDGLRALVSSSLEKQDVGAPGGPSEDALRDVDRLLKDLHSLIADLRADREREVERERTARETLNEELSRAVREAVSLEMKIALRRDGASHKSKKRKTSTPTKMRSSAVTDVETEVTASDVGDESF